MKNVDDQAVRNLKNIYIYTLKQDACCKVQSKIKVNIGNIDENYFKIMSNHT